MLRLPSVTSLYRPALLFTILLGFALRLYRLGEESLWYDETVSVVLAKKSVAGLIAHTAGDIHPPGYYLLLHVWARVAQPSLEHGLEFLFAWPSLFLGLMLLPLLFVIARRIHSSKVALATVALAAINPFHLWYSQEVRMYTLGAALGLICLWCLIVYWESPVGGKFGNSWSILLGYVVAAAIGLYSLYYFAFTLAGLNVIAACWFGWRLLNAGQVREPILRAGYWLAAQVLVLGLWGPWMPIFWRQAMEPPVPPWRVEWTLSRFGWDLLESGSALVAGQTLESWLVPVVAGVSALAIVFYGFSRELAKVTVKKPRSTVKKQGNVPLPNRFIVLLYLLVPISLIYLLTAFVTPLYHVRYLFTYAPVFMIVLAALLYWVAIRSRLLTVALLTVLIVLNVFGLYRFWEARPYRADDHRGATADLAQQWRPGDLLLVNAGWAYTAVETYWPGQDILGGVGSYPPKIDATERLLDIGSRRTNGGGDEKTNDGFAPAAGQTPLLVRTGSVDATENLGWGDPKSDFYAISQAKTEQALNTLATCYDRVWHYRIYDTVSDPKGVIRGWLEANGTLQRERWISGRDLGQVQLYTLDGSRFSNLTGGPSALLECGPSFIEWTPIDFDNALRLVRVAVPTSYTSGHTLYATLEWKPLPGLADEPSPLSMSLRLYADVENLLAQQDESPDPTTEMWAELSEMSLVDLPDNSLNNAAAVDGSIRQILALPLSSQLPQGSYSLELILYRQQDGSPLSLPELPNTTWGQRLRLYLY